MFRIQVAYHREPQVLRESVNAEGMLIVRDNEEAQALEMATSHRPLLTSMLHGSVCPPSTKEQLGCPPPLFYFSVFVSLTFGPLGSSSSTRVSGQRVAWPSAGWPLSS